MKVVGQEQLQSTYMVEIPSWAEMLEPSCCLYMDMIVCSVFNTSTEVSDSLQRHGLHRVHKDLEGL